MTGKKALALLIGSSRAMQKVRSRIFRFAATPIPLLFLGETGTGKNLCAQVVWKLSGLGEFASLNCAGLTDTLLASQLFGHRKGAFTGADRDHRGVLAQADGGILFLDEVSELHPEAQAALLTALDTGEYRRLGSERISRSRFRLLAATNTDLDLSVEEGSFRLDLRQRLGSVSIEIPPLRERPEDVAELSHAILLQHSKETKRARALRVTREAIRFLEDQPWPGNVRQLKNVLESAAALAGRTGDIQVKDLQEILPPHRRGANPGFPRQATGRNVPAMSLEKSTGSGVPTLEEIRIGAEYAAIRERLRDMSGADAAASLGISRATMYRILKKARAFGLASGGGAWSVVATRSPMKHWRALARSVGFHIDACGPAEKQAKGRAEAKVRLGRLQLDPGSPCFARAGCSGRGRGRSVVRSIGSREGSFGGGPAAGSGVDQTAILRLGDLPALLLRGFDPFVDDADNLDVRQSLLVGRPSAARRASSGTAANVSLILVARTRRHCRR